MCGLHSSGHTLLWPCFTLLKIAAWNGFSDYAVSATRRWKCTHTKWLCKHKKSNPMWDVWEVLHHCSSCGASSSGNVTSDGGEYIWEACISFILLRFGVIWIIRTGLCQARSLGLEARCAKGSNGSDGSHTSCH